MKIFDNSEFEKYKAEAKERWGKTEAYKEYEEKTKNHSQEQVQDAGEGLMNLLSEFAVCLKKGGKADSDEAQALVEKLQNYITDNYYTCTKEILAGLGQMYVLDERFRSNINKNGDGTAEFISEAIRVYTDK